MKKICLFNVISITYILIIILLIAIKVAFNLSLIGNYTNTALIILGLYLVILYIIKETQSSKVIGYMVFIAISFLVITSQLLFFSKKELYFQAPNRANTIIVVEKSSLLDGYSTIYEKKYWLFKRSVNWNRIEGPNNFSSGQYTIEWISESSAIIKCAGEHYGQVNID